MYTQSIYLGSCQGKNPVAGHGVFSPATPRYLFGVYISAIVTVLEKPHKEPPMKLHLKRHFSAFLAVLTLAGLIAACNSPMGMGPPVDTTAPTIFINTPADNEFIRGIVQGSPFIMTGSWIDDFGVKSLKFEIYNKTADSMVEPDDIQYQVDADGKWNAEITIPARVATADEYIIKVYALDSFGNAGVAEVNVRIDIIPPWVRTAQIVRHPVSGFNFTSPVYNREHYEADGYQLAKSYRNIQYNKLDEYQNETFTLRLEIEPSYADVAASRLYVKDEDDAYLSEEGLVPSGYWQEGEAAQRFPEWDITASQIETWRSSFTDGANYIFFEVWAWSEAAWDGVNNRPFPDEPARVQKIDGTVWYPQSDEPHVSINPENFTNDIILLEPNMENGLVVDFYDDDRLGVIYSKLITKQAFTALAGADEEAYLNSLIDPDDVSGRRAALISDLGLQNAFVQATGDNRFQSVNNGTNGLDEGEYRLIALVRDDKSHEGYSFESGALERWSVCDPVKIQIKNADAPFIFVENPERENVFPNLSSVEGVGFIMSGYTLGRMETTVLQAAWVPKALQHNGLNAAIAVLESGEVNALAPGQTYTSGDGIKVWKLAPAQAEEKTVLNGVPYFRADFSNSFHIINDFQYNNALENDDKMFVLHARNYSSQIFQTFNLPGLNTGPEVEVTSHRRGAGHDPNEDLVLRMRVSPSSYGAAVVPGSQIITDITGLSDNDSSFAGAAVLNGNEWTRTVTGEYIRNNYTKGSTRVYAFRARDILGNVTEHTREINMTDQPLLHLITCANEAGTYGIGAVLRFEAVFSMPVRVTHETGRAPRLKLYLTNPGDSVNVSTGIWADYDIDTPIGNTVFFSYAVQEGHTTNLLCTSLDAIELNGALITSYSYEDAEIALKTQDGSLQNSKAIKLDGDRPLITRASFAPLAGFNYSGVSYFTNGKTITLKLTTNEPVRISGSPQAVIRYGQTQMRAQYAYKTANSGGSETLYFTHTVNDAVSGVSNITPLTRLEWGDPWFDLSGASAITDMAGNDVVSGGYGAALADADRWGEPEGSYPSEQGYIKTTLPATPSYSLHRSDTDAQDGVNAITANPVLANAGIYLRVSGREIPVDNLGGTTLYYSLYGGTSPQAFSLAGNQSWDTAAINDADAANKYSINYARSQYSVVAWQEDLAGNRSAQAASRQVTINARFPELLSIEVALPDGTYRRGTKATFRLNFSDKVRITSGAPTVTVDFQRPAGGSSYASFNSGAIGLYRDTTDEYSAQLSLDWTATGTGVARNIKAGQVLFSAGSLEDEYGNVPVDYDGAAPESAGSNKRPIGTDNNVYTFQINRPNLEFRFDGPWIMSANPQLPRPSGEYYNGGVITGRTFTLTFDVPVTRVSGGYITVRPYGQWAIPPVLSVEDFSAILNHPAVKNSVEYTRRLTYVDNNGIPVNSTIYNGYSKTTHGVKDIGGYVRPDTATKWVLDFNIDPYQTTASSDRTSDLRDVFNAAEWKWQRVHAASGSVTVSGNTATITLNDDLLSGRIWEVLVDDGAFCDAAGNPCIPVTTTTTNEAGGTGYRFWSAGTAAPVVRVNRVSYDDRNAQQMLPNIDTEVRIDCETPGAAIRYDVMQTFYNALAGISGTIIGGVEYNGVFTTTATFATSDYNFFLSPNYVKIRTASTSPAHVVGLNGTYRSESNDGGQTYTTTYTEAHTTVNTGYQRNTIGNDDALTAKDVNGFFNTLLVPNFSFLDGYSLVETNGVPPWNRLTSFADTVVSAANNGAGVNAYRTVNASGAVTWGTYVYGAALNRYFYAGNASQTGVKTVSSHADERLYDGRRDYVAAAARKGQVNNTDSEDGKRFAGPQLAVSAPGMEGVYKTTVIYRNPYDYTAYDYLNNRRYGLRGPMMIFGFDQYAVPVPQVAGFPFKGSPDGNNIAGSPFYKAAYRIGGVYTIGEDDYPVVVEDPTNNFLWVTWEIVTDWHQSAYDGTGLFSPMVKNLSRYEDSWAIGVFGGHNTYETKINLGNVTATYGGVTYRYKQFFN
jgi:hypothetical protein